MLYSKKLKFERNHIEEQFRARKERLSQLKDKFQKRAVMLLALALLILVPIVAYRNGYLNVPEIIINIADIFFVTVISFLAASLFVRLTVDKIFHLFEGEFEVEQNIIFTKLYSSFIYMVALGIILWRLGVSQENIAIYLGFVTTGVAFAIREIILSFFIWLIVLQKKPFRIGDVIKMGEDVGMVTKIGTFFITIESVSDPKETVKIPNKQILEKNVLNMGRDRMYQEIKLEISRVPKDIDARIKKIKSFVNSGLKDGESANVQIDADGPHWYLKIKLIIHPENESEKSDILKATYFLTKDILKKAD
ncbi:MAG: mechanosensitive ion channel [Candidatus Aenigmarchaeota archaeon]|nr:mechanosensitive ion channel [Candidatus Aenigmarchaeota archaeon]